VAAKVVATNGAVTDEAAMDANSAAA